LIALLLMLAQPEAGTFDDFLGRYRRATEQARPEIARAFVAEQRRRGGFPIVEGNTAVFFYVGHGGEKSVRLTGDFLTQAGHIYWDERGEEMEAEGAVFWKRRTFEADACLDYRLVIDGTAKVDPLNPHTIESGIARAGPVELTSELAMPGCKRPAELVAHASVRGTVQTIEEPWASPKVSVYLPAGYDPASHYPVVYTTDGSAWIDILKLPTILDNLIADRAIEPVIAVMIDPGPDRSGWYQFNPGYLTYLDKVVRYVDGNYGTRTSPQARLHLGTSAGGRASLYVGLERPRVFGNIAMLSPSLAKARALYEPYFTGQPRPDRRLRVWVSAGSYEKVIAQDAQAIDARFRSVGITPRTVFVHEAHTFGAWRRLTVEVLRHFFPARR
jgi:enterochelin esterase-like enzyme